MQLTRPDMNYMEEGSPINASPSYLSMIEELPCTEAVVPAIYRAGIVKDGEDIYGVVDKGRPGRVSDSLSLAVSLLSVHWANAGRVFTNRRSFRMNTLRLP